MSDYIIRFFETEKKSYLQIVRVIDNIIISTVDEFGFCLINFAVLKDDDEFFHISDMLSHLRPIYKQLLKMHHYE